MSFAFSYDPSRRQDKIIVTAWVFIIWWFSQIRFPLAYILEYISSFSFVARSHLPDFALTGRLFPNKQPFSPFFFFVFPSKTKYSANFQ